MTIDAIVKKAISPRSLSSTYHLMMIRMTKSNHVYEAGPTKTHWGIFPVVLHDSRRMTAASNLNKRNCVFISPVFIFFNERT